MNEYVKMTTEPPCRSDLKTIIDQHNTHGLPRKDLAGTTIAQINCQRVYYNEEGRLSIGTNIDRIIRTSPAATNAPLLSNETLSQIARTYSALAKNCPFSNASPILELMHFYRDCQKSNPNLSLAEAFASFRPDPLAMHEKYQSGNCVILSAKIKFELQSLGIENYQVSTSGINRVTSLPIIGVNGEVGILWTQHLDEAQDIAHVETIIPFQTQDNQQGALILHTGMTQMDDIEVIRAQTKTQMARALDERYPDKAGASLESFDSVLKKRIAASYKLIITETTNPNSIFGIDLLQGNIYISSAAMKGLESKLPLTESRRVSIPLEGLQKNEKGTYFIGGVKKNLYHAVALSMLIEQIQKKFRLPEDTKDNILDLASYLPSFFKQIAMKPLQLLKKHYAQIQEINNIYSSIYENYTANTAKTEHATAFFECQTALEAIHSALSQNNEAAFLKAIKDFHLAKDKYKH